MENRKRKLIALEAKKEITESVRSTFECKKCKAFPDMKQLENLCRNGHKTCECHEWERNMLIVRTNGEKSKLKSFYGLQ